MDNWTVLCLCLAAAVALVNATDDTSDTAKDAKADKRSSYIPSDELAKWSQIIKPGLAQIKRYQGRANSFHYGDLIQYLNSVGKRSDGSKRRIDNTRYSDLIDYLNAVGKRGQPKLSPETAVNNPYFRRFEDAMKFEDLRKYLQRIGR